MLNGSQVALENLGKTFDPHKSAMLLQLGRAHVCIFAHAVRFGRIAVQDMYITHFHAQRGHLNLFFHWNPAHMEKQGGPAMPSRYVTVGWWRQSYFDSAWVRQADGRL